MQALFGIAARPSSHSQHTMEVGEGAKAFGACPFSSAWQWLREPQTEVASSPLGHAESAASASPGAWVC